jgi:ABC-type bacteriocin/lantibiotic exporter with double-glycine peptidase domain
MTLALSSCGALRGTIDHTVDQGKILVTHVTDEIRALKTETLEEVRETVEEITPKLIESILNADGVAFLIVSVTFLLSLVVVVALILLLGTAWSWWRRIRSDKDSKEQADRKGTLAYSSQTTSDD